MASNVQAGTRGLSASDWIRIQRLKGSRNYQSDKNGDITNSNSNLVVSNGRRVHTEFGTSKIRRPASSWTDYKASQTSDYVLERQDANTKSRSLDINYVCRCFLGYSLTNKTYVAFDQTGNVLELRGNLGLNINDPIVFSTITTCNSIISGKVYYVKTKTAKGITISETIGGPEIDISACEMTIDLPTITVVTLLTNPPSAIKHNGPCVKCNT